MLADESGDIASLELSSTRAQLRRPIDGADFLYHTNCFFQPEMCGVQVPAEAIFTDRAPTPIRGRRVLQSANCRRERFGKLLSADVALRPDQLQAILSDPALIDALRDGKLDVLLSDPKIVRFANDPRVQDLTRKFAGEAPTSGAPSR